MKIVPILPIAAFLFAACDSEPPAAEIQAPEPAAQEEPAEEPPAEEPAEEPAVPPAPAPSGPPPAIEGPGAGGGYGEDD